MYSSDLQFAVTTNERRCKDTNNMIMVISKPFNRLEEVAATKVQDVLSEPSARNVNEYEMSRCSHQ